MPPPTILQGILAGLREREQKLTQRLGELDAERDRAVAERSGLRDEIRDLQAYISRARAAG